MKLDKSIFTSNAKAIRKMSGKTQTEFGEIIGCNRCNIGSIEEGRAQTIEIVFKYSKFSGISMEFLLLYKIKIKKINHG